MKTVLLVDDEEALRTSLETALLKRGFQVIQASNGHEAIRLFSESNVDLILTDVRMPEGTGEELLNFVKQSNRSQVPVIMMTGFSETPDQQLLAKGASAVLSKPFSRQKLNEVLEEVLK